MCVCVCECCKSPWMDKMCTRHTGRTIGRNTPPNVLCMRMTAVIEGRRMRYTTQPIRHWMTQQFEIMASRRANTCERYCFGIFVLATGSLMLALLPCAPCVCVFDINDIWLREHSSYYYYIYECLCVCVSLARADRVRGYTQEMKAITTEKGVVGRPTMFCISNAVHMHQTAVFVDYSHTHTHSLTPSQTIYKQI